MRAMVFLLPLALLACAKQAANPIEVATSCIHDQVPKDMKVSVAKAREVISNCAPQLDAWSRFSIEGSFKRGFDESDPQMAIAFSKHRNASQAYWLNLLSDEYVPSSQKL